MARIRSVKPTFATSEAISALSIPARLHFVLLWTYCDDEGRGVDNARILKGALWPLDDDITSGDVENYQAELERAGRIVRYEVDGRTYFEVVNFSEHQKPNRPIKSKLPAPSHTCIEPASEFGGTCISLASSANESAVVGVGVGVGDVVGEGVVEPTSAIEPTEPPAPKPDYSDAFEAAWKIYPRRTGKKDAWKAWSARLKAKFTEDQMTVGAQNYADECKRERREEKYTKLGATFWGPGEHFMDYQTTRGAVAPPSSIDRDRTGEVRDMTLDEFWGPAHEPF